MCLSKIWKLQKFLQRRQIQARFDLKEKGRYKPLSNRRDIDKADDWSTLQKDWPSLSLANDVNKLNSEAIPEEGKKDSSKLINEINSTWEVFQTSMKALKGKRIPRNGLSKNKK